MNLPKIQLDDALRPDRDINIVLLQMVGSHKCQHPCWLDTKNVKNIAAFRPGQGCLIDHVETFLAFIERDLIGRAVRLLAVSVIDERSKRQRNFSADDFDRLFCILAGYFEHGNRAGLILLITARQIVDRIKPGAFILAREG